MHIFLNMQFFGDVSYHRWELPDNYPVFAVVMVIYHYVQRIWRVLVTPLLFITYMTMNKYYPGEPINIHIQPLINIMQEKNWVITTKKRVRLNYHYFVVIKDR